MSDVIAKMEASGKKPEESAYRILQSACLGLKDNACVNELIEKLVANYPKPEYYQNLIGSLLTVGKSDKELLNILRLADGMGIMNEAGEYFEMADLATAQGLPGEAQYILEKGIQKGAITSAHDKDRANMALGEAKTAVALDKVDPGHPGQGGTRQTDRRVRRQARRRVSELQHERQGNRGAATWARQGWRQRHR